MTPRHHKLFYGSSYDRGLDILLLMWPKIREKHPDAELHVCYGWEMFDKVTVNNTERQEWKKDMEASMQQDGVHHWGRLGKMELKQVRQSCGIWVYPTYFPEINCITALEAQNDGLVPVASAFGALTETAKWGCLVDGDIYDPEIQDKFVLQLTTLMDDKPLWEKMSHKCEKFARKFDWSHIAQQWVDVLSSPKKRDVKVTIFTPTIREGWWNIMANNLAVQTHTNFEWIIVDDYKENRAKIAEKYASMYGLNIRYFRGKERKTQRTYGLVNANNTALQAAQGELFVFLQDFVLLTPTAIEDLVNTYRRHPNDLIAPCDAYYEPKKAPNIANAEDWFDGEIDVIGKFMRHNIKITQQGFRESDHPFDYEQNYGAIPVQVARELGGWYEFFDESLGFDNTEMAWRALRAGHKIWVDEQNIAVCIDHWGTLGKTEGGVNRTRRLNDPRFLFMIELIEQGKLPLIRTQEKDDTIDLQYTIPEDIPDEKCVEWIREHGADIASGWMKEFIQEEHVSTKD